jgi:D-tagatose-1,6-bisphosphate aldolase subunit GatZ/KbaZ
MPLQYRHIREGKIKNKAEDLLKNRVMDCINDYLFATVPQGK